MTNIPQNAAGIFPGNWQYWSNLRALPTDFRFASFWPRLFPQAGVPRDQKVTFGADPWQKG